MEPLILTVPSWWKLFLFTFSCGCTYLNKRASSSTANQKRYTAVPIARIFSDNCLRSSGERLVFCASSRNSRKLRRSRTRILQDHQKSIIISDSLNTNTRTWESSWNCMKVIRPWRYACSLHIGILLISLAGISPRIERPSASPITGYYTEGECVCRWNTACRLNDSNHQRKGLGFHLH
jgi:hypothetical protein